METFTANSAFQGKVKKFSIRYNSPSKGNYHNVSCLGEHITQKTSTLRLTSKVTTASAYNDTSGRLYKERYFRIEVRSELKFM